MKRSVPLVVGLACLALLASCSLFYSLTTQAPKADPGSDIADAVAGVKISLSADRSSGQNLSYTWSVTSSPSSSASDYTLSDALRSQASFTPKLAGTYKIILVVTNSGGSSSYTLTITAAQGAIPVTKISLDKTSLSGVAGGIYQLNATVLPTNATDASVTWASLDPSIVTVGASSGTLAFVAAGGPVLVTATTVDGGKIATCAVTVAASAVAATGINLSKNTDSVVVGGTDSLSATILPANATDQIVNWTSLAPSIATVSPSGTVTGLAVGDTTVIATSHDGGFASICALSVKAAPVPVTGIGLNTNGDRITVGTTDQLAATLSPQGATDSGLNWESANAEIATVSSSGLVTGKAVGESIITVTARDGGFTATCKITVAAAPVAVTGVSLLPKTATINPNVNLPLAAAIIPADATTPGIIWSSSDPAIAAVSTSGVVSGVSVGGPVAITAKTEDGNFTATCQVTVVAATVAVTTVGVAPDSLSLNALSGAGSTGQLIATVGPSGATNQAVAWSSGNTAIATVSSSGTVTAIANGSAIITATTADGGKTAACAVTVAVPTYGVTYLGNAATGGTAPSDSKRYYPDSNATVLGNTNLVKNGKTFTGWNTAADGTGTSYPVGSAFAIDADLVLYAGWRSVYLTGNNAVWIDGAETAIPASNWGGASIYASGADYYVAAVFIPANCAILYDKNASVKGLGGSDIGYPGTNGADSTWATGIFVSGSTVYISGIQWDGNPGSRRAFYLTGDATAAGSTAAFTTHELSSDYSSAPNFQGKSNANSVFVDSGKVYVAGEDAVGKACYWVNGAETPLTGGSADAASSIAVSGNVVYSAGKASGAACYWVGTTQHALDGGTNATSIAVSGGKVYVAGTDGTKALYWVDGQKYTLASGSSANAIAVADGTVFVAGSDGSHALLWINGGEPSIIGTSATSANAIFLAP